MKENKNCEKSITANHKKKSFYKIFYFISINGLAINRFIT